MPKYYGLKNPNYRMLQFNLNNGQVEIYETIESAKEEARLTGSEIIDVYVTATDLQKENEELRKKRTKGQINEAYAATIERQALVIREQSIKINKLHQRIDSKRFNNDS